MIVVINPTFPVLISSKDMREAVAMFLLDYNSENDTLFGVFMRDTGEFWWVPSYEVRLFRSWSMGRAVE